MKVLVTGAAGFVGINLCEFLLKEGHEVIGIDNLCVATSHELIDVCRPYNNMRFYVYDFVDDEEPNEHIYEGVDIIYHLGGMSGVRESVQFPDIWFKNNTIGTFKVLENARKYNIEKMIIASSGASIGNVTPPVTEDMPMRPISPYGASKGSKELFACAYYHAYGIKVNSLRFSNVYGPHSTIKISIIAKFIRKILNGESPRIYGTGEQTRDFIYIDDLINAIYLVGKSDIGGEVFQVSTNTEISVNKITELIYEVFKNEGYENIPLPEIAPPAIGDIRTNYADNSKIKSMINWKPKIELYDGLQKTIKWFIDEYIK